MIICGLKINKVKMPVTIITPQTSFTSCVYQVFTKQCFKRKLIIIITKQKIELTYFSYCIGKITIL